MTNIKGHQLLSHSFLFYLFHIFHNLSLQPFLSGIFGLSILPCLKGPLFLPFFCEDQLPKQQRAINFLSRRLSHSRMILFYVLWCIWLPYIPFCFACCINKVLHMHAVTLKALVGRTDIVVSITRSFNG